MVILQYIMEHSPFVNKDENMWMKSVIQVVRNTSLYFAPQRRTKILNEGWASYWHQKLFIQDDKNKPEVTTQHAMPQDYFSYRMQQLGITDAE